jgi:hypothetical protein
LASRAAAGKLKPGHEAAEPLLARPKALAGEKKALEQEREVRKAKAGEHTAMLSRLRELRQHAGEIAEQFDQTPHNSKRDILTALNLTVRLYPASSAERYALESYADGPLRATGNHKHR